MKVTFTDPAAERMRDIHKFYKCNVSEIIADKIIAKILDAAKILEVSPWAGQEEFYLKHLGHDHRTIIAGNYKIIYRIEVEEVLITDVFDARQDPAKMVR